MKNKIFDLKNKIKENFKNNKVPFLVCLAIWATVVFVTISIYDSSFGKKAIGNKYSAEVIEVNKETTFEQIFAVQNETKAITLDFSTFSRKNKGHVYVSVTGKQSGNEYANKKLNILFIQDNYFKTISLNQYLDTSIDQQIIVKVTSDSEVGKGVGLNISTYKQIEDGLLTINGEEYQSDLVFEYLVDSDSRLKFSDIVVTSLVVAFSVLILLLFLVKPELRVVFTIFAFIYGLIMMFVITPYSPPDEYYHYQATGQVSSYFLNGDYEDIDDIYYDSRTFIEHGNSSSAYKRIIDEWNESIEFTNKKAITSADMEGSYLICYIPQTIGFTIGRILKLNVLKTFMLGRFTSLVFYCVCVYFAIKKVPSYKLLFGIIATLPIFVQQAASYSYDNFVNSLSLLTVAYLLKWILEDKKIKLVDYAVVFVICLIIAPCKYIYGFMALLFWLVPTNRYKSKCYKFCLTLLLCVPMLRQLLPIMVPRIQYVFKSILVSTINVIKAETGETVSEISAEPKLYSLKYCLNNPLKTVMIFVTTIRYNLKTWFYGAMGRYLSGLSITLPLKMAWFIVAVVGLTMFRQEDLIPKIGVKFSMVSCAGVMVFFTLAGMLIMWTLVTDTYIQGIQGRYFTSLLPLVLPMFANKKFSISKKFDQYLIFAWIMIAFEVIMYVLFATFVI